MSDSEKKETIADKVKERLASATTAAKGQLDALKTKEGRDALKGKAVAYMNALWGKASGYWQVTRTKTVELWGGGTKGKAICIGVAAGVILLGCLVFSGKSEIETKALADSARSIPEGGLDSETRRKESGKVDEEELMRMAVLRAAEKAKQTEERIADSDSSAHSILDDDHILLHGDQVLRYVPEKKVSYTEFAKTYYTIEDAFLPIFVSLLQSFQSRKGEDPVFSMVLSRDIDSRVNHLLLYCCRTGLAPDATNKEKADYLKLLKLAKIAKDMIAGYAKGNNDAEKNFESFWELRSTLPKHMPDDDAEERYAALPYPTHFIDLGRVLEEVGENSRAFEKNYYFNWPQEAKSKGKHIEELMKTRKELAQKVWHPIKVGNFPIKTFCGLEFGQTIAACEKVLGDALGPVYKNLPDGFAAYRLKKPFRKFTRACLRFETDDPGYEGSKKKEPYFQSLRSVQLEADISEEINYESCMEELDKVKKLLEEKYRLNLGKGEAREHSHGRSYWYRMGLDTGWIVLGIQPATDGLTGKAKGGNKTMVLEVRCADSRDMKSWLNIARKDLDAKRASAAEAKKEKLNLSADAGADVL